MPVFTLIILIALAILGFYAIRRSVSHTKKHLEDSADGEQGSKPSVLGVGDTEPAEAGHPGQASMYAGSLGDYQKEETELALRLASEKFGRTLDFSHRSIEDVEAILSGAHDYTRLSDTADTDNLADWAELFACYIATVIQKQTGEGQLSRDQQDLGDDSYPFHWRGQTLFLHSWCHKRIFDGSENDVCRRYKVEILDRLYAGAAR